MANTGSDPALGQWMAGVPVLETAAWRRKQNSKNILARKKKHQLSEEKGRSDEMKLPYEERVRRFDGGDHGGLVRVLTLGWGWVFVKCRDIQTKTQNLENYN